MDYNFSIPYELDNHVILMTIVFLNRNK